MDHVRLNLSHRKGAGKQRSERKRFHVRKICTPAKVGRYYFNTKTKNNGDIYVFFAWVAFYCAPTMLKTQRFFTKSLPWFGMHVKKACAGSKQKFSREKFLINAEGANKGRCADRGKHPNPGVPRRSLPSRTNAQGFPLLPVRVPRRSRHAGRR